jgi:Concanavalin A-like lectin/glucanases superfamily
VVPAAAPAAVTVSFWHMDETSGSTMVDSVNGANGRLRNVGIGAAAHYGRGYRFNGSSSVVTVPHTRAHNVPSRTTFTVDALVRFPDPPRTVGDFDLVRKGLSGTDGGHWKMEIFSNGRGYCQFRGSSGTVTVNAGPRLDDDHWHRISCVKRAGSVTLVVDGRSYGRRKRVGAIRNRAPLAVGAKASGGDWYRGLMDEVSIKLG